LVFELPSPGITSICLYQDQAYLTSAWSNSMRISRVHIRNFRNFHKLDIALSDHAVVVGENRIGKSNLIYALRLILDPSLPDTARQLKDEDFWDGLPRPLKKPDIITISLDFADFEDNAAYLAVLGEFLVSKKPMISRLTYAFGPIPTAKDDAIKESDYEFFIYGADKPETRIGSEFRRRLPMDLLQALRDTESDIANWRRSPLRPMLDEVSSRIDREKLLALTKQISEATDAVTETPEISALADLISDRLSDMVGNAQALEMDFGFSPTESSASSTVMISMRSASLSVRSLARTLPRM
jgi:putative ATP-dependent endonuclease of OLD family